MRYIPGGEGGSAWAESLLALRARTFAKFGEVDTVPVSENSVNNKKYKNIRKKVFKKLRRKEKCVTGLEPETNRSKAHDLDH